MLFLYSCRKVPVVPVQHEAESDPMQLQAFIYPEWPRSREGTVAELRVFYASEAHWELHDTITVVGRMLYLRRRTLNHLKVKCAAQVQLSNTCWRREEGQSVTFSTRIPPGILMSTGLPLKQPSGRLKVETETDNLTSLPQSPQPTCPPWITAACSWHKQYQPLVVLWLHSTLFLKTELFISYK